uniref:Uncharacterized protein n=1 Tax=Globodera rostochiensis TaxID=31243 RepID=A0A914H5E6_GLORO
MHIPRSWDKQSGSSVSITINAKNLVHDCEELLCRTCGTSACAFSRSLSQDDFEYAEDLHVFFNEMEKASGTVVPACCYVDEDGIVRMAIRTSSMEIVRSRAITVNRQSYFNCDATCLLP